MKPDPQTTQTKQLLNITKAMWEDAEAEIKKLRGIIINLTNAAAVHLGEPGHDTRSAAFLRMEVKVALRDAEIKEGDQA